MSTVFELGDDTEVTIGDPVVGVELTVPQSGTVWDAASLGAELADLPAVAFDDPEFSPELLVNTTHLLVDQDGVAKKMPIEFIGMLDMRPAHTLGTGDTAWVWDEEVSDIVCYNTGAATITFNTVSTIGSHVPVRITRTGSGSVTLVAGTNATLNRVSGKPLTIPQYGVVFVRPYFKIGVQTLYVLWGDLA